MSDAEWLEWTRTNLCAAERQDLLNALTSDQRDQLSVSGYLWVNGIGVLWTSPAGSLRRRRFTHGFEFRTQYGEFQVDSDGGVRECPQSRANAPRPGEPNLRGHEIRLSATASDIKPVPAESSSGF